MSKGLENILFKGTKGKEDIPGVLAHTVSFSHDIKDVNNDFEREQSFQKQALESATFVRDYYMNNGLKFTRPSDFFAEMIKSDAHMEKIRQHLLEEKEAVERTEEAIRRREQKKYGKKIQAQKKVEKQEEKNKEMEKIKLLKKRKRGQNNEDDEFDIEVDEDEEKPKRAKKMNKREYKNQKFGFGGKKRMLKVNDAKSAANMDGFSVKKNKDLPKAMKKRPGKSKRQKFRK